MKKPFTALALIPAAALSHAGGLYPLIRKGHLAKPVLVAAALADMACKRGARP